MGAKPKLFQCPECGLHYTDEAIAKQCEAWCKQYKSCNLEITKFSEEAKAQKLRNKKASSD